MKLRFICLMLCGVIMLFTPTSAQKPKSVTTGSKINSTGSKVKLPPFKIEDLPYYIVVSRKNSESPKYTLPGDSPNYAASFGVQRSYLVVDSRTMRELAWWPEGYSFVRDNFIYVYNQTMRGPMYLKFTLDGSSMLYNKQFDVLNLSADLKHVYYINNGDAWIGDFDLASGTITNKRQVTRAGTISDYISNAYMRGNTLLLGDHFINIEDGSFIRAKAGPADISPWAKTVFFAQGEYGNNQFNSIWDMKSRKKIMSGFHVLNAPRHWLNREQTKLVIDNKDHSEVIDFGYTPPKSTTLVNWRFYVGGGGMVGSPSTISEKLSPDGKYFYSFDGSLDHKTYGLYLHNTETYEEKFFNIVGGKNMLNGVSSPCVWTDNTHLLFPAEEGSNINGQEITTENQGTYVLDIISKEVKRVTPYLVNFGKADKVIPLLTVGLVVFEANNYLFSCKADGSEPKQLTQPNEYKLETLLINEELK